MKALVEFFRKKIQIFSEMLVPKTHKNRMILGVCAGISVAYTFPVRLVRLLFVVLSFPLGFGIIAYLVLAVFSKTVD